MAHQDEWLDLVDENDQVIGKKLRSEIYAEGLSNFRGINAFIVNAEGKLWIPRRTATKRIFPSALDFSVGGHVESGENYEQSFARETREELNLDLDTAPHRLLGHLTPSANGVSCFMDVFEINLDRTPEYNQDDFVDSYWLTPKELSEKIAAGEKTKDDLPKVLREFYRL